jgi:hypothetical protein
MKGRSHAHKQAALVACVPWQWVTSFAPHCPTAAGTPTLFYVGRQASRLRGTV